MYSGIYNVICDVPECILSHYEANLSVVPIFQSITYKIKQKHNSILTQRQLINFTSFYSRSHMNSNINIKNHCMLITNDW